MTIRKIAIDLSGAPDPSQSGIDGVDVYVGGVKSPSNEVPAGELNVQLAVRAHGYAPGSYNTASRWYLQMTALCLEMDSLSGTDGTSVTSNNWTGTFYTPKFTMPDQNITFRVKLWGTDVSGLGPPVKSAW